MSEAVKSMFGSIANRYDLANRILSARQDVRWRKNALGLLDEEHSHILDVACGTYDFSKDALNRSHIQRVDGVDFCLPMLQAGHEKIDHSNITGCNGDALALPYADNSFDAAIMAYGWRNLDDPKAGLEELARVVRPGGQILILEFFRPEKWWPTFFYASFGRFVFPTIGKILTGDAAAYRYLRESVLRFVSCSETTEMMQELGYEDITWRSYFGGVSHGVAARLPINRL